MQPNSGIMSRTSGAQLTNSEAVSANNKIIFLALGAIFGFVLFMFVVHIICVKCFWGRSGIALGDESDETSTPTGGRERRRRYGRRRSRRQFAEPNDTDINGLDKSVVQLLPIFVFNPEVPFRNVVDCAVCLADFVEGDQGRLLPKCRHCFHVECIDLWFLSHSSCPLCRCEVSLDSPLNGSPDHQLPRSRSCPRFFSDHSHVRQQPRPLFGSSASIVRRFTDITDYFEECPAGSTSLRVPGTFASPASTVAITSPESAAIADAENSNEAYTLERSSSLPSRVEAADIAIESDVENSNEAYNLESESSLSSQVEAADVAIEISDESTTDDEQ